MLTKRLAHAALFMVLAMAVMGLMATGAQADLVLFSSGDNLPPGNPASEVAFLEDEFGLTGLTFITGIVESDVNNPAGTADLEWDLTGTGQVLNWVLVVDGQTQGSEAKLFSLYRVTDGTLGQPDQTIIGSGSVLCCDGVVKNISHITYLGGGGTAVPEPATLALLGAGLLGAAGAARLRRRK